MNFLSIILIGVGGCVGSVARYGISTMVHEIPANGFPLATFLVNIVGCFIIGISAELYKYSAISSEGYLLLATGFCGGFTTFSTFILDCMLTQKFSLSMTLVYASASIIIGYIFLFIGLLSTRFFLQLSGVHS